MHNLGGFDGLYIYKGLLNILPPNNVSTLLDTHNKFILISVKVSDRLTITFKDSLRIFPVSLNELCKIYNVEGKLTEYRQEFNHINILDEDKTSLLEELKDYNKQDSLSLFKALRRAQDTFYHLHRIDIVDIVSTSSLALKIFRSK